MASKVAETPLILDQQRLRHCCCNFENFLKNQRFLKPRSCRINGISDYAHAKSAVPETPPMQPGDFIKSQRVLIQNKCCISGASDNADSELVVTKTLLMRL
jgi:hypothetical protein